MAGHRPFRFGVLAFGESSREAWLGQVVRAEALGYSTLSVGEHVFTALAPVAAMASAAALTSTIRIGSLSLGNDFHHPVVLARELASLDVLSGGRLELGVGSGYFRMDYAWTGVPFEPPGARLDRFFEAVHLIKRAFTEECVDFAGEHYTVSGLSLMPRPVQQPYPPLLIGGGGRRVLEFAAREADIVGINVKSTPEGGFDWTSITPEATAQKIAWVRAAAGDRFPALELHSLVPFCAVTDAPEEAARGIIEGFGAGDQLRVADMLASPHALIGTEDTIVEAIQRQREEYGVSYFTVFVSAMDAFAPVVRRLANR